MSEVQVKPKHGNFKDIEGDKYGRLLVIAYRGMKDKRAFWLCRCDCGNEAVISGKQLRSAKTLSCGCLQRELTGKAAMRHGYTRGRVNQPEYVAYMDMMRRCYNVKSRSYVNYGGRGITVCERWRGSLESFLADMGPRPSPKHTLDRKNNDLGYSPENCRWATWHEQSRNRRDTCLFTFNGKTMCISDWSKETGIHKNTLNNRFRKWSVEKALTKPLGQGGRK